jgi:hypothetical protein
MPKSKKVAITPDKVNEFNEEELPFGVQDVEMGKKVGKEVFCLSLSNEHDHQYLKDILTRGEDSLPENAYEIQALGNSVDYIYRV